MEKSPRRVRPLSVRFFAVVAALLWLAAGSWATVVTVAGSSFGDEVLWLAIVTAVMVAIGMFLLLAALAVNRLLSAGLTASSGLAFGVTLLFVAVALNPPDGMGNVAAPFIVLMTLCGAVSAAGLSRHRISRTMATWSRLTVKQVFAFIAGLAWIAAATWSGIFASIVSALGGFVLLDLLAIAFMVVMGIAMLASVRRVGTGRETLLIATSAVSALGLSFLTGVGYARVASVEGIGGGELLIGSAILALSATASLLSILIRPAMASVSPR